MANPAFDTMARSLETAGLPEAQARAIAKAIGASHGELATKTDLVTEIAGLKTSLVTEIANGKADNAGLKADIADLKTSLVTEIASVKVDNASVKTEFAGLKTYFANRETRLLWLMIFIGGIITGAIFGLLQAFPPS